MGKRPADEAAEGESQAKRSRIPPPPHSKPLGEADATGPSRSFTPINPGHSRSRSVEIIGESGPNSSAGQPQPQHPQQQQQQQQQQPQQQAQQADDEEDDDGEGNENRRTSFKTLTKAMMKTEKVDRLRQWCLDLALGTGNAPSKWKKDECIKALLAAKAEVRVRKKDGRSHEVVSKEDEAAHWPGNAVRRPRPAGQAAGQGGAQGVEGQTKQTNTKEEPIEISD
jgi:hypothetical protein